MHALLLPHCDTQIHWVLRWHESFSWLSECYLHWRDGHSANHGTKVVQQFVGNLVTRPGLSVSLRA